MAKLQGVILLNTDAAALQIVDSVGVKLSMLSANIAKKFTIS